MPDAGRVGSERKEPSKVTTLVFLALLAAETAPGTRAFRDGRGLLAMVGLGAVAGEIAPAVAVLVSAGPAPTLTALALMVVGNFAVRWAIVMLPHRELAVGPTLKRDGNP